MAVLGFGMGISMKKSENKNKENKIQWQKSVIVTVVLILMISVASFVATGWINRMEKEKSFDRLYEEAAELAKKIEANAHKDSEQLEMLAVVIGGYSDLASPELWEILDSYTTVGMMSRVELLMPDDSFDIILSSLAFHYVKDFEPLAKNIYKWLKTNGEFVFSVEHPVFTSYGTQDWYYDSEGNILHFPVDNYYYEGKRDAVFLGEHVTKYHRTLTTYLNTLLQKGFELQHIIEPKPPEEMMNIAGMKDEMRRPMMLLVSAIKK